MIVKIIKIALAILSFICTLKYALWIFRISKILQPLSWFAILAYYANENGNKIEVIIFFIALAVLFQPLAKKIALGKYVEYY
jgi:hypothetical protein